MKLITERLVLRPYEAKDLLQRFAVRPDYYKYLALPELTPESVAAFFSERLEEQERGEPKRVTFAIEAKVLGHMIGAIRIEVRDVVHQSGDLGFALDSEQQGHGYMTEALQCVLTFGFDDFKLHRIWATADIENEKSWRLLERAGMKREGLMREDKVVRGAWRDSYLYAILEEDDRP
jgi:RimJ/RimL family protein N-acetyltransferase